MGLRVKERWGVMKNRECAYCGAYNEDCEKYCAACGKTLPDYPDYEDDDEEAIGYNGDF